MATDAPLQFGFTILRPGFLSLLIPMIIWYPRLKNLFVHNLNAWKKVVDPHLLPSLPMAKKTLSRSTVFKAFVALWVAGTLALAGPSFTKTSRELYKKQVPTVLAVDLSYAMNAADVGTYRGIMAVLKAFDTLSLVKRQGGFVVLVAYSDEPYLVAPITDDTEVAGNFLKVLSPALMPTEGSRPDRAIDFALETLNKAGITLGNLILYTNSAGEGPVKALALESARRAAHAGLRVSAIGIGTEEGAELEDADGRVLRDKAGKPVVSKLDKKGLEALAKAGYGRFSELTASSRDIRYATERRFYDSIVNRGKDAEMKSEAWFDAGVYVVPVMMLLALYLFRRGVLWALLLAFVATPARAGFLVNGNQRGLAAYREGDYEKAAELFEHRQMKALSLVNAKRGPEAAEIANASDDSLLYYNVGTALAQNGEYGMAIPLLEKAVESRPDDEDAAVNLEIARRLNENPPPPEESDADENDPDQNSDGGGGGGGAGGDTEQERSDQDSDAQPNGGGGQGRGGRGQAGSGGGRGDMSVGEGDSGGESGQQSSGDNHAGGQSQGSQGQDESQGAGEEGEDLGPDEKGRGGRKPEDGDGEDEADGSGDGPDRPDGDGGDPSQKRRNSDKPDDEERFLDALDDSPEVYVRNKILREFRRNRYNERREEVDR